MTSELLKDQAATFTKPRPELRPGYTVRVHEKIKEGEKERIQVFEGLIISMHKGRVSTDTTFTVRRIVGGIGVERIFALQSPLIDKIEVKKVAKIRRAKLFFLRGRRGKAARLSERFTNADEFSIAAADASDQQVVDDDDIVEAPVEEPNESEGSTTTEPEQGYVPADEEVKEEEKKGE
ncbi:50S ribosomal protein L19 [Patescibacteria group bacterium]|nr:50S ribosomal protein L19 [Patescibacteria group bacterium]MBU1123029.1 50S ribosomal protein L19 [Patescibacteria group bacterium]